MSVPLHLLLLAGAGEAREIAVLLADQRKIKATASLQYPERAMGPLEVPTRIGRFGGDKGFLRYLQDEKVGAVLDATHPFATGISARSARICASLGVPYAQVLRPEWQAGPNDNWIQVADEAGAAAVVPVGAKAFTTTGRATLGGFKHMLAAHLFVRQLSDDGDRPTMKNVTYVLGIPPFSVEEEMVLFQDLEIDWLITRNAGGDASRTKLDAAQALGLPVAMIQRPPQPDGLKLETVAAALNWVRAL